MGIVPRPIFGIILSILYFCTVCTIIHLKYSKVNTFFWITAYTVMPLVVLEGEGAGIFQMVGCCLFGWPLSHKAQHNGDPVAVEKLCALSLTGPLPLNFNNWCHNLPSEWRWTILFFGGDNYKRNQSAATVDCVVFHIDADVKETTRPYLC